MRASSRRGSALIEVLVALVLFAIMGTGLITLVGQTSHSMRSTLESERLARRASEELASLSVLSGPELAALTGRTARHGFTVSVAAVAPRMFDVDIGDSATAAMLLRTTFYRPDTADAR